MKADIHPTWYPEAQVACACGNKFTVGSTLPQLRVEVCYACHPFFTGQMRYVDTRGRVDKFETWRKLAQERPTTSKKERRTQKRKQKLEEELSRPTSLEEVRSGQ